MFTTRDGECGRWLPLTSPSSSGLTRKEVSDGFQIDGFVSLGLINLHLEKACLLEGHREENISFYSPSLWSEVKPYWETFHDHCFLLSHGAWRLISDQVKVLYRYVTPGVNFQTRPIDR